MPGVKLLNYKREKKKRGRKREGERKKEVGEEESRKRGREKEREIVIENYITVPKFIDHSLYFILLFWSNSLSLLLLSH